LAAKIQRVDLLINAIGALQTHDYGPEKSLRNVSQAQLVSQMMTNALPTLLLAKHFTQSLKRAPAARIVTLSARVGSIADNQLGGWYSYRASKAALNMLVKTLAIEWQRTLPAACVIAYHPGTVKTKLSEPFVGSQTAHSDSSSSEKRLLTPAQAAERLLTLTEHLQPKDSGRFWDWRHEIVPW
jgi:NAD(P)-dependent dehydrogenase (short-subunit alcohol dehydrogenase family)